MRVWYVSVNANYPRSVTDGTNMIERQQKNLYVMLNNKVYAYFMGAAYTLLITNRSLV